MLQFSSPPISTPQAKLNIPDAPMMPIGGFGAAPAAQEVRMYTSTVCHCYHNTHTRDQCTVWVASFPGLPTKCSLYAARDHCAHGQLCAGKAWSETSRGVDVWGEWHQE